MAKIISVHIEGFCSVIGKIKYKFDRIGLNLITGKNGAGKTTMFNALAYGLYGQTLKPQSSILPWPHVLDENYRGCKIEVRLDDNYRIIRLSEFKGKVGGKIGNNRLLIEKDGIELKQLRNKSDAQNWINTHLGYSWHLFKAAVLFPQELASILEEDGPAKKKIFDEAFASDFINQARKNVENTLQLLSDEHTGISAKLSSENAMLENNRALLEQMDEENLSFQKKKGLTIANLRGQVKAYKLKKSLLKKKYLPHNEKPKIIKALKECNDKRAEIASFINHNLEKDEFQLMLDINRYQSELEDLNIIKDRIKGSLSKKCDSCGQSLRGDALKKYRQEIKAKFVDNKKKRGKLTDLIKSTSNRHESTKALLAEQSGKMGELVGFAKIANLLEKDLYKVKKIIRKIRKIDLKIQLLKKEISTIRRTKVTHDTTTLKQKVETGKDQVRVFESVIKDLEKDIDLQKWLIKDPLSNSGLKAFIFDSMLRRVNYYLQYYTKFIGFRVSAGINLEAYNKDFQLSIWKGENEVPYKDISKGQKQLAKVVLCLSINKTLQAPKPINILLFDELFESLDPENVEIVGNIISQEAKNRSIHLITHHMAFNPNNCYKTFVTLNDQEQTVIEQKYRDA